MLPHALGHLPRVRLRIEKDQHRRPRTAEGDAENAFVFYILQRWQQRAQWRAVGLVQAILECCGKKFGAAQHKGAEQQHRILNVRDRVSAGILRRQHTPCLLGWKGFLRHGQQQRPLSFWPNGRDMGLAFFEDARNGKPAHPTSSSVVRMMFAAGSLAHDLSVAPSQASEMVGQGNARQARSGRRSATFADGNLIVDLESERPDCFALRFEDFAIGGQDEVVVDSSSDFPIAASGSDGEFIRNLSLDSQEH